MTYSPDTILKSILPHISNPCDIQKLSLKDKLTLAEELRSIIIKTVSNNGGHLAPSLGVIELTLALLATFNPAEDKLLWDVGHQTYAWKLLTGRAHNFSTLRKLNGLSGFPKITESQYDHFGAGHAATSISAALGMAMARDLQGLKHHVIAIIGDGSLTAGMAFEGLNQAGAMGRRLIVVLNDNEMSISKNVGALSLFLSRNMERGWVRRVRHEIKDWLKSIPGIGDEVAEYASRTHRSLKTVFTPGILFEAFRFNYIGPVNGHDIESIEKHLAMAASIDDQPVLLHVLTKKGKGYEPAEKNPASYHGLGAFDIQTGIPKSNSQNLPPTYTEIFGKTLCELAEKDKRIVTITAAMASGTGTSPFKAKFPTHFTDVGICEQHAVTFAAGLASQGYKPFVAIYSTFAQRAYDQIIHDVCIQKLPVTFCLDRAGIVGEDGATHHGAFDISFLRCIPNMSILAPRDEAELQSAIYTALSFNSPLAIRYPKGNGVGVTLPNESTPLPFEGELLKEGHDVVIIAIGSMVMPAYNAAQQLQEENNFSIAVFDSRWISPLPQHQLIELANTFSNILLIEENALAGGFSSAVIELFVDNQCLHGQRIQRIGLPNYFIDHGSQKELKQCLLLTVDGIKKTLLQMLQQK